MGTYSDLLSATLFSRTREGVLALLYGHPDRAFYLREIVELTRLGIGQVEREVGQLSAAGIIRREARGRHVYFQAEPACPIFEELRGIVTKTAGGVSVLRHALEPFRDRIRVAFIYGSVARGEEKSDSDLDLMVIGEVTLGEVAGVLRDAEARLHRSINPTVYPIDELRAKLTAGHHFLKTVLKGEKVFVAGDEHELGSLLA
jgi:predicted nucleotidyltransferase